MFKNPSKWIFCFYHHERLEYVITSNFCCEQVFEKIKMFSQNKIVWLVIAILEFLTVKYSTFSRNFQAFLKQNPKKI